MIDPCEGCTKLNCLDCDKLADSVEYFIFGDLMIKENVFDVEEINC